MGSRTIVLLAVVAIQSSSYALVAVEPLLALSPQGSVANFTCVAPNGSFLRWDVIPYGIDATLRLPGDTFDQDMLSPRGIYAVSTSSSSVLYINATLANNGTLASCVLMSLDSSAWVTLITYDRPLPPSNLSSRLLGSGRLLLTWTRPSVPTGVQLWYVVVAVDQGREVGRAVVDAEQYEYSASASPDAGCQAYQFTVTAANDAGQSIPSQPLISSLPEVPREQSVEALPMKSRGIDMSIVFDFTFQACAEFPVQYCCVVIQNTQNLLGFEICNNNGSDVEIVVHTSDGLQPNMKYVYTITAVNMVGNSTSAPQIVYTTDVQSSTITGSDHQLNVTCFFAEGTQARGCAVCLEKSGEVVYQMVPRVNETAKGVIRTDFSVDCYNISVVDWEEDGSIGSLGVPVNSSVKNKILECGVTVNPGTSALCCSASISSVLQLNTEVLMALQVLVLALS